MRAAVISAPGTPARCQDFPEPDATAASPRVRVTAAPVPPIELLIASGATYLGVPPCPYVPGLQGVGVTDDGARVLFGTSAGMAPGVVGSMAEYSLLDPARVLTLPDDVDDITAAALGNAGPAAIGALRLGGLADGQTVIILGASGTVGQVGIAVAKAAGARVIAVGRGEQALARARELGADDTVDASSGDVDTMAAALAAACGDGGAQLVLDPIAGAPAAAALRTLSWGGALVNLGDSAGPVIPVPSALIRSRMITVRGYTSMSLGWEGQAAALNEAFALVAAGALTIDVEAVPLEDAESAWTRMAAGQVRARLVLVP